MDKIERHLAILVFDGVNLVDIAGPAEALKCAEKYGRLCYRLWYISPSDSPVSASCGLPLVPDLNFDQANQCDDLIITGGEGVDALLEDKQVLHLITNWLDKHPDGRMIWYAQDRLLAKAGV